MQRDVGDKESETLKANIVWVTSFGEITCDIILIPLWLLETETPIFAVIKYDNWVVMFYYSPLPDDNFSKMQFDSNYCLTFMFHYLNIYDKMIRFSTPF